MSDRTPALSLTEQRWRPNPSLLRATLVGAVGLVLAVTLAQPAVAILSAGYLVHAAFGLAGRPRGVPQIANSRDHVVLTEGQGTVVHLHLRWDEAPDDGVHEAAAEYEDSELVANLESIEQVTRVAAPVPFVASRPVGGAVADLLAPDPPDLWLSPRRWGRRVVGYEAVSLNSAWAGFRWGPVRIPGEEMLVLPKADHFSSRGDGSGSKGLVGEHRSSRVGTGSEFAGVRAFAPGDRLRQINWRVSARTSSLHVTTTLDTQDLPILLVVDALADHGASGGIDGAASTLDTTIRAAAAIAEHSIESGDRVALRILGADGTQIGFGASKRHLRRMLSVLASIRPVDLYGHADRLRLRVNDDTQVVVLSPMLTDAVGTATAATVARGLPTMLVDTMPEEAAPEAATGVDADLLALAWRMRKIERTAVTYRLERIGCPVVGWRGPGTLDEVIAQMSQRGARPVLRGH